MSPVQTPPPDPAVWATLRDDLRHAPGLKTSVGETVAELEAFYLDDGRRRALVGMGWIKRWFLRCWWLLKALFFKLAPGRRIVFVIALILVVLSRQAFEVNEYGVGLRVDSNFVLFGAILLIVLLMLELKDKLIARKELEAGRAVQQALMPGQAPHVPGWDVWFYTQPANDVGGDLVDALTLPGRSLVGLADVAGKALPAALLMAKVQATLRALAAEVPGLPDLAARVNAILCRDGLPNRFATLVYAELRPESGRVSLVNAGHLPPFVVSGGRFHELPRGGMALGMVPGSLYQEQQVELEAGAMLVVYSDGVTEAMNAAGEFFGDERLRALLPDLGRRSAAEAGQTILTAVEQFIGRTKPYDDLSVVVIKRQ